MDGSMYGWIKLFEVVKKKGVHSIQTNKNNAQESFLIIDHFLLISLISKIDQGKIKTIKKNIFLLFITYLLRQTMAWWADWVIAVPSIEEGRGSKEQNAG